MEFDFYFYFDVGASLPDDISYETSLQELSPNLPFYDFITSDLEKFVVDETLSQFDGPVTRQELLALPGNTTTLFSCHDCEQIFERQCDLK